MASERVKKMHTTYLKNIIEGTVKIATDRRQALVKKATDLPTSAPKPPPIDRTPTTYNAGETNSDASARKRNMAKLVGRDLSVGKTPPSIGLPPVPANTNTSIIKPSLAELTKQMQTHSNNAMAAATKDSGLPEMPTPKLIAGNIVDTPEPKIENHLDKSSVPAVGSFNPNSKSMIRPKLKGNVALGGGMPER